MIILKNAEVIQKKLEHFSRLDKPVSKTITGITLQGVRMAKSIAPVKTGKLKRGIFRRVYPKAGRGYIYSMSRSVKNFPEPNLKELWINEVPPYNAIHLFGKGKKRTYKNCRGRTGVPRYFYQTYLSLKVMYPQYLIRYMNEHMKQTI